MYTFRYIFGTLLVAALPLFLLPGCGSSSDGEAPDGNPSTSASIPDSVNALTEAERREGWQLLFDGRSLDNWRGFQRDSVPAGWTVENGAMHLTGEASAPDGDPPLTLVTTDAYSDFELRLEWKISPGGNSGILYRVSEQENLPYETGPEYQVLDNAVLDDEPVHQSGALYGLYAPENDVTRPVGTYNETRIVVRGAHVEHWLNGTKLLEAEIGSDTWQQTVEDTKFANWSNFAQMEDGHIALQDHGHPVWYRDIRIRSLSGTGK